MHVFLPIAYVTYGSALRCTTERLRACNPTPQARDFSITTRTVHIFQCMANVYCQNNIMNSACHSVHGMTLGVRITTTCGGE